VRAPAALRGWRALVLLGIALALAAAASYYFPREPTQEERRAEAARFMNELMLGKAGIGGPFTLSDQKGKAKGLADFRGMLVVLYFGYTFCPDVCPTDLAAIARLLTLLGPDAGKVQPVFVTLDPERDTQEVLRYYIGSFGPRFVALRGTEAEVRRVANLYRVYFEKVPVAGASAYVIDHTAFIYVIDRDGKYIGFFPPGTTGERMAALVRERLAQPG
jgi:cytochrome oxidase Cu insertion factor (SCO1/SenC/PrrC family)